MIHIGAFETKRLSEVTCTVISILPNVHIIISLFAIEGFFQFELRFKSLILDLIVSLSSIMMSV